MEKRKLGLFCWFFGAFLLAAGTITIILYFAFKSENNTAIIGLLIGGIALLAVALVLMIIGYKNAFVADKNVKQAIKKYMQYDCGKITDYKKELDLIRNNFYKDADPNKNLFNKRIYVKSEKLYDFKVINNGLVYFGYVVSAAPVLYHTGNMASFVLPAKIIYSTDKYFEENPLELKNIIKKIKDGNLYNLIHSENDWVINVKLPESITDGRDVYVTDIMAYRKHLPIYCLSDSLVPIVAAPESSTSAFIVDFKYWSENFIGNFARGSFRKEQSPADDVFEGF